MLSTSVEKGVKSNTTVPGVWQNAFIMNHNESTILFCGIETNALVDSGSQVTTVTEEYYRSMNPQPILYTIEDLNLDLYAAGGNKIPLLGAIEATLEVPFLPNHEIQVPVVVVPTSMVVNYL